MLIEELKLVQESRENPTLIVPVSVHREVRSSVILYYFLVS